MSLLANLLPFILPLLPQTDGRYPTADLVFAGDAMMHKAQIEAARTPSGSYDFGGYFDAIRPYIESADFAAVNFEASLGGKPHTGYPCFSAPDAYALALADAGFDLFLLANNHILDRRDRGLLRTLDLLETLNIPHTGVYRSAQERDSLGAALFDVAGYRLGLVNCTYGTNGISASGPATVNYIDLGRIRREIAGARSQGAEIVGVCIHWGDEYKLLPNARQRALADSLTALGADMIIGGHPHVVQPMEMRSGPDGRPVLLVYSLGNFVSAMKTADTRGGALVRVTLGRDSMGRARVESAAYGLVYVDHPSSPSENFRLLPAHSSSSPRAETFRRNAERIFSAHNRNVPVDSLFLNLR